MHPHCFRLLFLFIATARISDACDPPAIPGLKAEVAERGWIVFSAHTGSGDWDLFVMRPNGDHLRPLTRSAEWNEILPRVSPDGTRLLYRRLPREETPDGNRHGQQGVLVVARLDASDPRVLGKDGDLAWASWSPDGKSLATLGLKGISFVDAGTGKVRRTLPRAGLFQQLTWSPDGLALTGVSNGLGTSWSVVRMDAVSGQVTAVSRGDCCTPDWFPDGAQVVFSNRRESQRILGGNGWTELWRAQADGSDARLLVAEEGRHLYGGQVSPDGRHVLFTGNAQEDGDPANQGAPMFLVRLSDTPMVRGNSDRLRQAHPGAKDGPVLQLSSGWEPFWTPHDLPPPAK